MYVVIITIIVVCVLYTLGFVAFMVRAAGKEREMRAMLINQMEATQQAERKSMNKSQAFASASHDIRGSLAGISGLIDLCRQEVTPGSELDTNLKQVSVCTTELVELLNSVLDMSKIESGKMQLEEEDFNLTNLVEDVIDFFHPLAMRKEVDIVLDLASSFKSSNVRGDSGKLKQILNNLVSNAVKFTEEGHVSIRACGQRPDSSIRNNDANTMEFVFEVDDTGKGVPMEMRKSVFENYVQVRETAQGTLGTGLGLGIVQSLVRLMGGEIRIIDKAMGERGTCFQFNVLLTILESEIFKTGQDIERGGDLDYISTPNLGLTINTSMGSGVNIRNLSPRFNNCLISSPKQLGSRVVLLLKDEERRKVTERYIKSLGVKVTTVEKWEHLSHDLERVSGFSPTSSKELPLIGMDGVDSRSQVPRKRSYYSSVVLVVVDAKAGPLSELQDIVETFRRGLQHNITCRVVWLNDANAHGGDVSYLKPLHGSRLIRVLKMLPEFGGAVAERSCEIQEEGESNKAITTTLERESYVKYMRSTEDGFLKGKRVLVVDDNRIASSIAARKLRKMGCEVIECGSGKEAVRLVNEWLTQRSSLPFDYIFMDCQMPEMDGYEATREIRRVERRYGLHIPIIAVSGHDRCSKEAEEAIEAGMDAFLDKNMNQQQLWTIIRNMTLD